MARLTTNAGALTTALAACIAVQIIAFIAQFPAAIAKNRKMYLIYTDICYK